MLCTSAAASWLSERAVEDGSATVVRCVTVTGGDVVGPLFSPVPESKETHPLRNSARQHKTTAQIFRLFVDRVTVDCCIVMHFSSMAHRTSVYPGVGTRPSCLITPNISTCLQ